MCKGENSWQSSVCYCVWLEVDSKDNLPEKETLLAWYAERESYYDVKKLHIKGTVPFWS